VSEQPIRVEWGVVLDDAGSTDVYDTEAEALGRMTEGDDLVRIETWPAGSADAEALRAEVERLREDIVRLSEQHQAARHLRDQWKSEAMRHHRERDAALTEAANLRVTVDEDAKYIAARDAEAATVRAAIEAECDTLDEGGHTVHMDADGEPDECTEECPGCVGDRLRAVLAANPAPPALTVTYAQIEDAWDEHADRPDRFLAALGVTVADEEADRG
jgi:hypothetical protein